jgi:hypothetical protein
VLALQPLQPGSLLRPGQLRRYALGQRQEVGRVRPAQRLRLVPWLRPLEPLLQRLSQAQSQHAVQAMKTIVEG